jgi:hypothetical protein
MINVGRFRMRGPSGTSPAPSTSTNKRVSPIETSIG